MPIMESQPTLPFPIRGHQTLKYLRLGHVHRTAMGANTPLSNSSWVNCNNVRWAHIHSCGSYDERLDDSRNLAGKPVRGDVFRQ